MPKRRKDKSLSRGPFTAKDWHKHLGRIGYARKEGGKHALRVSPDGKRRVPISDAWTSIRVGDPVFRSLARGSGLGEKGLLRVLNGLDP
jgi:hypothetical protein